MKEQVKTLVEMMMAVNDNKPDKKLKVFSIVGFGGLGKTTLAIEVCRQLEAEFQRQAQVSVSQAFDSGKDLEGLIKRVLQQIVKARADNEKGIKEEDPIGDNIDKMTTDELAGKLKELLNEKRYLIVIDDVWTIPAWDAIRSILPENNCGSKIVVTTRMETVAKACSSASVLGHSFVHRMKPLGATASKELFVNRVFGSKGTCPDELKASMDNILKKCGGLPLAIVSIASLLASYKSPGSKEMWNKICNSIGYEMESNPTLEGMRQIVTLSYNHLPHHLKACMLYLSIFPEDYEIKKKRLLRRWIAEGLVVEKRGLTLLEVAETYFDELVSRNMIDPVKISYDGRVKTCHVHDMMLEVIVSICLENNFVSLVGAQCGATTSHGKIRRLSVHSEGVQSQQPNASPSKKRTERRGTRHGIEGASVQHVRSLSTFHPEGHQLLDRLDEFTLLRVLDLEECKAVKDKHMKHVCRMFLLKFLNLNGTDITVMPYKIGELVHLQTLSLRNTCLGSLPESVTNLEKLEFLYFSSRNVWDVNWRLPRGLGKMKALRVVDRANLCEDAQVAQEIGELTQLRKLNVILSCSKEVLKVLACALSKNYSLRTIMIIDHAYEKRLNVLLQLSSPPPLLRSIGMNGEIDGLPSWFESLTHLVKIDIAWTELRSDQILGVLYKLPNLLNMVLGRRSYTDNKLVASSEYRFPVLKNLSFTSHYNDEHKIFIFQEGSMAMLEKLEVRFDDMEKSLSGIEHLTSLKEVQLIGTRSNAALNQTVEQLKSESNKRQKPNQFKVAVRYE